MQAVATLKSSLEVKPAFERVKVAARIENKKSEDQQACQDVESYSQLAERQCSLTFWHSLGSTNEVVDIRVFCGSKLLVFTAKCYFALSEHYDLGIDQAQLFSL